MTDHPIDVVHVGSASRDLAPDDPRGWRLGGGATYAALTTARLGLRTAAIVGVDREAGAASELDLLREAGVELRLLPLEEGPVFHNREADTGRVQACLAVGRALPVPDLPERWRRAPAWSLVPVAGELGDEWASVVPPGACLALGWQGLLRILAAGRDVARLAPARSRLLDRADLVGVSRHDLEPGTSPIDVVSLLRPGARLVVTDGPAGGILLRRAADGAIRSRPYAAVTLIVEVDPTGAGDVFLAALLVGLVRSARTGGADTTPRPRADLRFAAAAASFAVEGNGLLGVPRRGDVLERIGRTGPAALPPS
jgi:sugar/nucleoside kinase (ribokinase family)